MKTESSIWRGVKLAGGKVSLSAAAVDDAATESGDAFLAGLPKTADGSIAVAGAVVPTPPATGTYVLKSVNGVVSWSTP